MRIIIPFLASSLLFACGDKDGGDGGGGNDDGGTTTTNDGGTSGDAGTTDGGTTEVTDQDGDGYSSPEDCDDTDPDIHPDATEVCDGVDNNCDDVIDTDAVDATTIYEDVDGDGYGNPLASITSCDSAVPANYTTDNQDCRDSDPDVNPDGQEVCDEQDLDEDCDGLREDDDDSTDTLTMTTYFADNDLDGFGDPDTLVQGCDPGGVRSLNELDCDDSNPDEGPSSSCTPFDGVWTGAMAFDVDGVYGYSGECTDEGSITISDSSATQVSGSGLCDYYGYYPITFYIWGEIDYPWGVSGYWSDQENWFSETNDADPMDESLWLTSFTGEFSEDGSTLVLSFEGERDELFGSYDVSLEGDWTLYP